MRAIIDATGYRPEIASLLYYKPTPLLCVGGKPIIFHVIEFLAQQKITQFDIVLNHLPQKIEKVLGDGKRWGIAITYHLARNPACPFQVVRTLAHRQGDAPVVFALGDSLPSIDPALLQQPSSDSPLLFMYPNRKWTGWAVTSASLLEKLPKNLIEEDFPGLLNGRYKSAEAQPFLSAHSPLELQQANIRFLASEHALSIFPTTARLVEPGVWISRGVSMHPTVKIVPPVFIGEFTQINKEACIGPNAIIEEFCIIDEGSEVVDSIVCRRSYVGENLTVQNSIIDRNLLLNLSLDSHVVINDGFILGESFPRSFPFLSLFWIERCLAALLFALLYPVYLIMHYTHHLRSEPMLKLPAENDRRLWQTIDWKTFEPNAGRTPNTFHRFFRKLPLLMEVVRGNIHFVGVLPRSIREVELMSPDWKKLYISSKVGIIAISDLEDDVGDNSDKCYTSESVYATQKGLLWDLKFFFRWIAQRCKYYTAG